MKLFVKLAVGAWAAVIGISTGHSFFWIEASESDDTQIAQSALDDLQNCRDADDSWADCDAPVSAIFQDSAGRVASDYEYLMGDHLWLSLMTRVIVRNDAFAGIHNRFASEFAPWKGPVYVSRGWGRTYRESIDVNQLLHGNFISWYVVEWSGNLWTEPKRFLSDDEFHSVKVDLISNRSPFLRMKKSSDLRKSDVINNPDEDSERSIVTSDPLSRLLESSGDHATRTEWKVARLQLISLLKHTPSGSGSYHRVVTVGETRGSTLESLNGFEHRAVDQLETNQDETVVTRSTDGELQIVGALRSDWRCAQCHKEDDRTLLGVFIYRLKRADPTHSFPDSTRLTSSAQRHIAGDR